MAKKKTDEVPQRAEETETKKPNPVAFANFEVKQETLDEIDAAIAKYDRDQFNEETKKKERALRKR